MLVGAIDGRVVGPLTRLSQASVEGLARLVRTALSCIAVGLQEIATAICQGDRALVSTERRRANESFAFKLAEASPRVLHVGMQIAQVAFGHDPKGADGRQHPAFGSVDFINAVALANELTPIAPREI